MMDDNSIPVQQIDETNLLITVRFLSDPKCSYLQKEGGKTLLRTGLKNISSLFPLRLGLNYLNIRCLSKKNCLNEGSIQNLLYWGDKLL